MNEIEKEDVKYTVTESKTKWTVSRKKGQVTISYGIPKDLCPTYSDLCQFLSDNALL